MFPRTVVVSPLARTCKTAALLLILGGVMGLLAHSIVLDNRSGLAAVGTRSNVH